MAKFLRSRGQFCGLISTKFMAEMLGAPHYAVKLHWSEKLKAEGRRPRDVDPREIGEFLEWVYEQRKKSDDGSHLEPLLF